MRLQQEKRDDLKKVRILILCCRAFLREQVQLAEAGKITEGTVAAPFETLLRWMTKRTPQKAATDHKIDWKESFPLGELENTFIPRLRQVLRKLKPAPSNNGHSAPPKTLLNTHSGSRV